MSVLIWNRAYDRPRLQRALNINMPMSTTFDTMDQYHVLFNSLPRKLGFATACLPSSKALPAWKHLSNLEPGRYSALDSITLLRNHYDITALLAQTGATPTYDLICRDLDPTLEHMSQKGLLVDQEAKAALERDLTARLIELTAEMNALVPEDVKSPHIWKSRANAEKGKQTLVTRLRREADPAWEIVAAAPFYEVPGNKKVRSCARCGIFPVTQAHTKRKTAKEPCEKHHLHPVV